MSDITISEKNCTIPLGKLSNQSILEISLNNLSIKLISVPRYEKTNTAKSTRIWAPRLPWTCHYVVSFSSLDYLGQFRVRLLLTLPASHGSCWGWANPVWISTLPELWRWSLRMMSECHCRRCHIDESVRGTSLHQTTTQRDPCNTTQTECVLFYSQVCTCLLGPWVTPGGGNYVIINI